MVANEFTDMKLGEQRKRGCCIEIIDMSPKALSAQKA
jgi:hypothetical protein